MDEEFLLDGVQEEPAGKALPGLAGDSGGRSSAWINGGRLAWSGTLAAWLPSSVDLLAIAKQELGPEMSAVKAKVKERQELHEWSEHYKHGQLRRVCVTCLLLLVAGRIKAITVPVHQQLPRRMGRSVRSARCGSEGTPRWTSYRSGRSWRTRVIAHL